MDETNIEIQVSGKNQLKFIKTNLILGDRRLATILLNKIIPHINNDLFLEHVPFLLQNLANNLETLDAVDDQILSIAALTQILIKIYKVNMQNLNRELSLTIIPNMIKRLMQFRSHEVFHAANCLSILATLFPTLIAANRQAIEKRIFQLVDSIHQSENVDQDLLKLLGFCYCKIYLSGPTALMTRWREIISKIMNSFLTFAKHPIFSHIMKPAKVFTFTESGPMETFIMDNKSEYSLKMAKKLYFISATLCSAITGQFPLKLPLPIEAIVECLNMMVIISTTKLPSNGKEPNIHSSSIILQNVFTILRALIITCQSDILCYSRLVIHIINTTIEWMQQQPLKISSQSHLFSELRCSVLKCLVNYFETLRLNTCLSSTEFETILNLILENVSINDYRIHKNETIHSIRCLNSLINNSSNLLDKFGWQKIHNSVIKTLLQIYRQWFCLDHPYSDEICRLELLKTVQLLLINLDVENDVPLEAIINVLEEANRLDNSVEIRQLTTSTIHLTNYVLLSRIPVNNVMLQSDTSETNGNGNLNQPGNDQIEKTKRKVIDDEGIDLIPSSSKHPKITMEIVDETVKKIVIEESNDQQEQNINKNVNIVNYQTSTNGQMEIESNDEKLEAFEPSSSKQLTTIIEEVNKSNDQQQPQQQKPSDAITITIEDSSDDDDDDNNKEPTMLDTKKSETETKHDEDVEEILKFLVE